MRITFLCLCLFIGNIASGQINYKETVLGENGLLLSPALFPEKNEDGEYRFNSGEGYILTSYKDSLPEGIWSYYSIDSILISISYFHKGEILYAQHYESGKLYYEVLFKQPFAPMFGETVKKIPGIGLYGSKAAYFDNQGYVELSPTAILKRYYEKGKVINESR